MDDFASQQRPRRRNLTDKYAKLMKGRQGIVASYNAQAMVSPIEHDGGATGMFVTAVEVVDQASHNGLMIQMMKGTEEKAGTIAGMTLADAGRLGRIRPPRLAGGSAGGAAKAAQGPRIRRTASPMTSPLTPIRAPRVRRFVLTALRRMRMKVVG